MLVGSFSKTYAMTGWRIGYLLGPSAVVRAVENVQSHATSNATSFAMVGALEALRSAEPEVERMIAEYQARRDMLVPRLNGIPGFRCRPPDGAFYAFPEVSACFRPGLAGLDGDGRATCWRRRGWRSSPGRPSAPRATSASPSPAPGPPSPRGWSGSPPPSRIDPAGILALRWE